MGERIMTDDVIRLADNLIGLADVKSLESYGAHVISHGWATRFAWGEDGGDPRFDLFRGGADERLALRIGRHRSADEFFAEDAGGQIVVSGALDHVMAELDEWLAAQGRGGSASA